MDIDAELLYDFYINIPRIIISGKTIIIDNVKRLLSFTGKSIVIDTGHNYTVINGEGLIIKKLEDRGYVHTIKSARKMVERDFLCASPHRCR